MSDRRGPDGRGPNETTPETQTAEETEIALPFSENMVEVDASDTAPLTQANELASWRIF
jgi:hypothetical protein